MKRQKTPETEVSRRVRAYAAGYAKDGRHEYAAGMRQAADIFDKLIADGGTVHSVGALQSGNEPDYFDVRELARRVAVLEEIVGKSQAVMSNGVETRVSEESVRIWRSGEPKDLLAGEERILAAIAQSNSGRTNDELTAIVDLRQTSLRTYLGNLRAADYVETHQGGVHHATDEGKKRALTLGQALPVGRALYEWWLPKLNAGEARILEIVCAKGAESISELVGGATGLQQTSVRTYVGELIRRKLVVRVGKGRVAMAPILRDEGGI